MAAVGFFAPARRSVRDPSGFGNLWISRPLRLSCAALKIVFYFFRILSYAAGTGALICYVGGPSLRNWMYGLVGVSFACFVIAMLLMVWLRLRRRNED